ncbi:CDP-glycerol glycerophosphotransferase family protein [Streptococcus mitis]|uniref:Teichoic acid biosynthesis protein n=1 Tax=Streptococcus mitis TaxID=28037 RepID=A0A7X1RGN6_STRMT|nr:CDP-glycerol glycerophosphotransferase family protein [Streptococcus mitis]MQQ31292.1 teichoic acid biosynthesis protein [Streptococcus mitis]MQQ49864.1 teichoic acid biosynthesis protein [Streptococcus mitis]
MINYLKPLLFKVSDFTYKLNKMIPKKRNRIVLYSNWGFRDNLRTLYHYLVDNGYQETYEIVCASNDFYHLEKEKNVKYVSIYQGFFYFLTSKYFFYSFGKYPIKPAPNQMVVNLWHGMPLKKIGNLEVGMENIDYNFFTKLVSSSELFTPIMKAAFNAKDEQMLLVGNIRNDELFKEKEEKKIIWMPTYRNSKNYHDSQAALIFSLEEEDFQNIDELLSNHGYELYIKLHPLEESQLQFEMNASTIHLLTEDIISEQYGTLYTFLGTTSALITDYSSVFLDYYLLNRPVAFTINDYEEYKEKRGFVFEDVKSLMVGSVIRDSHDLLEFLESVMKSEDPYIDERKIVNNKVNAIQKDFTKTLLDEIGLKK